MSDFEMYIYKVISLTIQSSSPTMQSYNVPNAEQLKLTLYTYSGTCCSEEKKKEH